MAIWVSKDALGPQECRPMPIDKFWIGLKAKNATILALKIFLCIFCNVLCKIWGHCAMAMWYLENKFFCKKSLFLAV